MRLVSSLPRRRRLRSAFAAVEFAIVVPFLTFLFVVALDWARVFYYSIIVNNCARNGAMYAVDPYATAISPYSSLTQAALADSPDINPTPSVSTANGTDTYGKYVDCTVSYTFQTITNFPGVPRNNPIVRTVRVYQAPQFPN